MCRSVRRQSPRSGQALELSGLIRRELQRNQGTISGYETTTSEIISYCTGYFQVDTLEKVLEIKIKQYADLSAELSLEFPA